MKTGILFTAGVTSGEARLSLVATVNRLAARRFPGVNVRWGAMPPAPRMLQRMKRDGFTHVAVQPLCVVGGSEFERVRAAVDPHQGTRRRPPHFALGAPLLQSGVDVDRIARALLAGVSPLRKRGDALIAIGHGSAAPAAGLAYLAAAWALSALDPLAFLGCLNGSPDLADVRRRCRAARVKRALLVPFTTAAGSTLRDVLAPTGLRSWVAALAADGIAAIALPQGLGENEAVAEVWLDHAETALHGLETA